jgi:TonB family protein
VLFDLNDNRPDTPRVPDVISRREGVLLSLVVHGAVVLLILFPPFRAAARQLIPFLPKEPVTFVQMVPRVERPAPPVHHAESSDLDRRSATRERAPDAANPAPLSRGDTTEKVVGGKANDKENKSTAETAPPLPATPNAPKVAAADATPVPAPSDLRGSLKNLQRYLDDQNFNNQKGGLTEQDPDIQFDSKGVDFGPWLRRFVAQVKRNWLIPMNAMSQSGKVVITFYVMRDGSIRDLQIIGPSSIGSFNNAALNALKMSNPTVPLPTDYPADKAFFTVTFHYNEGERR